jgi:hypothetical protein
LSEDGNRRRVGFSNLLSAGNRRSAFCRGNRAGQQLELYKVIAADFGLEKFWETSGRSY